jgi:hypothetical protein
MNTPRIKFDSRPLEVGHEWHVVATYPRGQEEHITGFRNEAEAKDWIAKHSRAWLKKRGYLDP